MFTSQYAISLSVLMVALLGIGTWAFIKKDNINTYTVSTHFLYLSVYLFIYTEESLCDYVHSGAQNHISKTEKLHNV